MATAFGKTANVRIKGHLWGPLFILKTAFWPSDIENVFSFLKNSIKQIKQLGLNECELNALENILLCRKDLLEDKDEVDVMEYILEKSLNDLIIRTVSERRKFVNILLAIPQLFNPTATVLHNLLFKPIIGLVPIETVIETI
ncbi:hypothetical protein NQ315_014137 [Exocentrus adspersus]|uniref:Uncharacterized protein n=1 Tax=Exocentrus adspersus TaxID=1586481 RepID=A0AAV8VW30_9CUCU|nr:hypothetical protein NQ315_014137 [Exocentrus adspersus]